MPLLAVLQAAITLWLACSCYRYAIRAAESNAALWQALAELRMQHNALENETQETFRDVGEVIADLDGAQCLPVWPAPQCTYKRCRERRQLGVN